MIESNNTNHNLYWDENINKFLQTQPSGSQVRDLLGIAQDPTYLSFKIFFEGIGQDIPGLLGNEDNNNSALFFLRECGDRVRFDMLKSFIELLKRVNSEFPWYWQSISGIDEAWARKESMASLSKEGALTITCLETIDLKISALIDLYRKICYDFTYRREVLTGNLRKFKMTVMVYDPRRFYMNVNNDRARSYENQYLIGNIEDLTTVNSFWFQFSGCSFDLDSGKEIFSELNSKIENMASQSITIDYTNVEESNLFRVIGNMTTLRGSIRSNDYDLANQRSRSGGYVNDEGIDDTNRTHYRLNDYVHRNKDSIKDPNKTNFELIEHTPNTQIANAYEGEIEPRVVVESESGVPTGVNALLGVKSAKDYKREIGQKLGNIVDDIVSDLKEQGKAEVARYVQSRLNSLYLGNIYGFSARNVVEQSSNAGVIAAQKTIGKINE